MPRIVGVLPSSQRLGSVQRSLLTQAESDHITDLVPIEFECDGDPHFITRNSAFEFGLRHSFVIRV